MIRVYIAEVIFITCIECALRDVDNDVGEAYEPRQIERQVVCAPIPGDKVRSRNLVESLMGWVVIPCVVAVLRSLFFIYRHFIFLNYNCEVTIVREMKKSRGGKWYSDFAILELIVRALEAVKGQENHCDLLDREIDLKDYSPFT